MTHATTMKPMSTPEWLRPVSERFLGGHPGRPPWTVWLAAVLCGACALVAAGMVAVWGPMTVRLTRNPPIGLSVGVAALLAAVGAVLCATFALGMVLLARRGWFRPLVSAGVVLGSMAVLGLCVAAGPDRLTDIRGAGFELEWGTFTAVTPWLVAAAVTGFGLVLVLRTGSASSWLAKRRYQVRRPGSERERPAEQAGGG